MFLLCSLLSLFVLFFFVVSLVFVFVWGLLLVSLLFGFLAVWCFGLWGVVWFGGL